MEKEKFSNLRAVRRIGVIVVSVNEGKGTPNDPIRRVHCYFNMDGDLLWHNDPEERKFRGDKTDV